MEGKTVEQLEKEFDIASARFMYALQQKLYWENQLNVRLQKFNVVTLKYRMKKCGLTEDDLKIDERVTSVWNYVK